MAVPVRPFYSPISAGSMPHVGAVPTAFAPFTTIAATPGTNLIRSGPIQSLPPAVPVKNIYPRSPITTPVATPIRSTTLPQSLTNISFNHVVAPVGGTQPPGTGMGTVNTMIPPNWFNNPHS